MPITVRDGGYYFPAYFGRFIDSLASEIDHLILFAHRSDSRCDPADYQLFQTNIELVLLPEKKSSPSLLLNHRRFTRMFEAYEKGLDAFLVRGPTTLMPFIAESLKQTPMAFLMVGDHLEGLKSSKQASWRKSLIEKFWQFIYRRIERKLPEVMVIANSEKLVEKYKKKAYRFARTHTTTISEDDLWIKEDTCNGDLIQLLYCGRIAQEKRIDDIIEAVDLLQKEYSSIVLNIVGWDEAEGKYINYLQRLIKGKGLADSVKILGYIPAGAPLMQKYRECDIFVLASYAEGFPRVLWEAMANCLPIVSTNVGSIPDYIGHFIDLVPPNNPVLLAEAIKKVILDSDYRKKIIKTGFNLVQDVTLEKQTRQLVSLIEEYANRSK